MKRRRCGWHNGVSMGEGGGDPSWPRADAGVSQNPAWLGLFFTVRKMASKRIEHNTDASPLQMCSVKVYFCIMKGIQNTERLFHSIICYLYIAFTASSHTLVNNICRSVSEWTRFWKHGGCQMSVSCRAHCCTDWTCFDRFRPISVTNAWTWHRLKPVVVLVLVKQIAGWTNTALIILIVPVRVSTKTDVMFCTISPLMNNRKVAKWPN